jgi:hypothetical protein
LKRLLLIALLLSMGAAPGCETGPVETGANPPPPPTYTSPGMRYRPNTGLQDVSGEASEEDAERMKEQAEEREEEEENE